jgi:hypothetical protein
MTTMIDDRWIEMLDSPDVEKRKRAVKALAQTREREALRYLAVVYKEDADDEVRELARKGGVYIRKALEESEILAADYRRPEPSTPLYQDDRPAASVADVEITRADEDRAKGLVKQALDWHMRDDNERAARSLRQALVANPRLATDPYTITLAGTILGMDGQEAMRRLTPNREEIVRQREANKASPLQLLTAYVVLIGSILMLIGYLFFPWFDMSGIETVMPNGEVTTVSAAWQTLRDDFEAQVIQFEEMLAMADSETRRQVDSLFDTMFEFFDNMTFEFSGLTTTSLSVGAISPLTAMGQGDIQTLIDAVAGQMFADLGDDLNQELERAGTAIEPQPLSYTLFLIPVLAVLAAVLAGVLLWRSSVALWLVCVVVGLIALVPLGYYYLEGEEYLRTAVDWNATLDTSSTLDTGTAIPVMNYDPTQSLLGSGFWFALVGVLMVTLVPFAAMLLAPAPKPAEAT